jgi:translation initiation factor 3 subunit C
MCDSLLTFFQEMGQYEFKSRIALIKIIYLHYKNDSIYEKIDERLKQKTASTTEGIYLLEDSQKTIAELVQHV